MNNLNQVDIRRAADKLGVEPAKVWAVTEVESNGGGFLPDGRVKVQYEPHIMYKRLKANFGIEKANKELVAHPKLVSRSAGDYNSPNVEDAQMDSAAKLIDRTSSLESASWGAFQIMGYHWKALKFPTLQAFINAQYNASGQLDTFVRFIQTSPALLKALKAGDWAAFAKGYNGAGYKANRYDEKLKAAYDKYASK